MDAIRRPGDNPAKQDHHNGSRFSAIALWASRQCGRASTFVVACATIIVWAATGPIFAYSDTWQLVINTGTTIVTFVMVFLIQRTQNKDSQAVHLKLNELVAAVRGASNRLINAENLTEEEITALHAHYCTLVELAKTDGKLTQSHSVEEAAQRHKEKQTTQR